MVWFASEWVNLFQMIQFLNLCVVEQAESFKILRSLRLEGTLESLMWNLIFKMGSAKRSEVAPVFVQSGIENPQEWRLHNLFGHPVLLLDFKDFYCEKIISSNPIWTLLATHTHCPPAVNHCEEHASFSLLVILISTEGLLFF